MYLLSSWSLLKKFGGDLCNNCRRPGHFARECPNVLCYYCGIPGDHIAAKCPKVQCRNCKELGHMASNCPNVVICHACSKGHLARGCSPGDLRLCRNCYKPGHIKVDCTNKKACSNCRKTDHLAHECTNEPVCNLCNISVSVKRQCAKSSVLAERGRDGYRGWVSHIICWNCNQVGHSARSCTWTPGGGTERWEWRRR